MNGAPPTKQSEILFAELAQLSASLAATRSRLEKKKLVGELLARLSPDEIAAAVGFLVAEPFTTPLGVGYAHLAPLLATPPAENPTVTLREVERTLSASAGRDDVLSRLDALFRRFTAEERRFFVGALTQTLRQGSLGGVMILALADRAGRSEAEVRRAVMVKGSLALAASALLGPDAPASPPSHLELFRPLVPMLAQTADSLDLALANTREAVVEWKVDGVRAQVHKQGDRVAVYSRSGNDITRGAAPLLDELRRIATHAAVFDGEIVLEDDSGHPCPFQDTFSAVASGEVARKGCKLRIYLFDCMHDAGEDLLDRPLAERWLALCRIVPESLRIPRVLADDREAARRFYAEALFFGHEGVMVKDLASPYRFGARGKAWHKVKEHDTLDLVILAVEWGSGRRKGTLSNLHLGARREDGSFCMVGKTFKGLTDEMLRFQTERLQQLAVSTDGYVVHVRPELVVEIRYNDVQRSPRYPGGVALRFARVVRYREDKRPDEVDRIEDVVARLPPAPAEATSGTSAKKKQLSLFGD